MSTLLFHPSSLPVSDKLHALLNNHFQQQLTQSESIAQSTYLTFNFRDSSYSSEAGGFHPVEIAMTQISSGLWNVEYITDFAYVGNVYPELARCLDFDFRDQAFFTEFGGWSPIKGNYSAVEMFELWQDNFLNYIDMEAFDSISITP
ncbi:DUF2787 domain-containing protein [Vibrio lentus]|uniref:DUF2787 domain-containing protein n=1 Tax=Vibrio lentus TaxID=136468 RepID=A0AB36XTI9_9VIBR|nr:DUF2787 domain-containing protein [Vibrio lentus]MCC4838568.1 DUF2787 domain-containing protein [Vibrio lentus]PMI16920.1 hypothetical protein BCU51_05870 [Vibrio lentus]PMK36554.1 hypothetical protein BCU02_10990 [Vibrio lentus]PMK50461.1 hypothetical protein BCT99_03295 [Vibrio lentus]PML27836.1 hypothetical protein BCT79_06825 [Vibrio lentus]